MENEMEVKVIEVLPELLALCERVEEQAKLAHGDEISWAFFPQLAYGAEESKPTQGAMGFCMYAEYSVATFLKSDGSWASSVYWREVSKYDSEGWETHACDDDYEDYFGVDN
jgi:hypothetical protein